MKTIRNIMILIAMSLFVACITGQKTPPQQNLTCNEKYKKHLNPDYGYSLTSRELQHSAKKYNNPSNLRSYGD